MTQISQYGLDNPNDIQIGNIQHFSDSEDENRDDEIKKAIEEFNETFDYDSDDCAASRSSSVNHNSILDTSKDNSYIFSNWNVNGKITNGVNGVNLNMLPNAIVDGTQSHLHPFKVNGNADDYTPFTPNGILSKLQLTEKHNGTSENNVEKPKKQVTIVESIQKNREDEEIEASNPTISFLHKDYCPRNENGSHVDKQIWLAAENREEQMKTFLEIRERQIHRGEEEINKLQKDKRSLNHQIGMMKTEMVQLRNHLTEGEKTVKLKEEECDYVKRRLREAIEEFEAVRIREVAAHDQISNLNVEIDKLRQEVQLLSNIGSSAQQAEINDVVRQLREKHAAENVSWKKMVSELEGELRTYKRHQQKVSEESVFAPKVSVHSQTDAGTSMDGYIANHPNITEKRHMEEKTQIAIMEDEVGGDMIIKEKKIISLNKKFEELKQEFEEEKMQMVTAFEAEIEQYRHRLATLPNELYQRWLMTHKELGLQVPNGSDAQKKPIYVDAFTSPDNELNFNSEFTNGDDKPTITHDTSIEAKLGNLVSNSNGNSTPDSLLVNNNSLPRDVYSTTVQTDDTETINAMIQTDETLQTYKILEQLLGSWSMEVQQAKANEDEMTVRCREYEEELNKFRKQFKILQKVATKCRKESKRREEALKKQNEESKARYMEVLQKLDEKLEMLA